MRGAMVAVALMSLLAAAAVSVACLTEAQPPREKKGYCRLEDLASVNPATTVTCETCLTKHTQCCDLYGDCEATGNCAATVATDYRCVAGAGTLGLYDEQSCLEGGTPQSNAVYGCMKDNCANECGLAAAACTPEPAVPFITKASCDRCATVKCCTTINSCYQSRTCKLTFDCILKCTKELGAIYSPKAAAALLATTTSVCSDAGSPSEGPGEGGVPDELSCVRGCVNDYIDLTTTEGRAGGCASLELFSCTYTQCRDECKQDDAGMGD